MKIYNVKYFIWGIIFLIPLPLFAFGSIKADWWQWMLSIGISLKYLSVGLSKSENERQEKIEKNYQGVSQKLFGKYVIIKTNLPWVITGSFFSITLFVRFVFDVIIPVWIVVCFVIVLTISVFYSIGIERKIAEYIDKMLPHLLYLVLLSGLLLCFPPGVFPLPSPFTGDGGFF